VIVDIDGRSSKAAQRSRTMRMYGDAENAGSTNRLTFSNSSCGEASTGGAFRPVAVDR
jgi:hypothetical protein